MGMMMVAATVTACSEQATRAPAPSPAPLIGSAGAGDTAAPEAKAPAAAAVVSTPGAAAKSGDADKAMQELVTAAKKWLAADRSVSKNELGYKQAYERHLRQKRELSLGERMPKVVDQAALKADLEKLATRHGLLLKALTFQAEQPAVPVPKVHTGVKPFEYTAEMLVGKTPVQIVVMPPDTDKLRSFFKAVPNAIGPLTEITKAVTADGAATLTGVVLTEAAVEPPKRTMLTPTPEQLAKRAGVAVPQRHRRMAELDELLAKHRALADGVGRSLEWLAKSHLESARFELYRKTVERLAAQSWPPSDGMGK